MASKVLICELCGEEFASRTKLYRHLCLTHGWDNPKYDSLRIQRSALLIGWIAPTIDDDVDENWLTDERRRESVAVDLTERELLRAIYAVENKLADIMEVPLSAYDCYPKGYSRCSRSTQRSSFNLGIEASTHGLADLICMPLLRIPDNEVESWVIKVNRFLPDHITLHRRYEVPAGATDFNAEISSTQRRYEIMMPLSMVISCNSRHSDARVHDCQLVPIEKAHVSSATMDFLFPRDTPEGIDRIEQLTSMKKVMKVFNTTKEVHSRLSSSIPSSDDKPHPKLSFHNFVNGGITADETASKRRIDRFYHKQLLSYPHQNSTYVVFSLSGDDFLQGQVRRIIAVVIAIKRGWLSIDYLYAAFDPKNTIFLPLAPSWAVYIAECRYVTTETKYTNCSFDPRRSSRVDTSRIDSWLQRIQQHIASNCMDRSILWLDSLHKRCDELMGRWFIISSLRGRSLSTLQEQHVSIMSISHDNAPEAYMTVLELLRKADKSGLWPSTSFARQTVIEVEAGRIDYGSFSVGSLPRGMAQPKGNTLFPELVVACFRLEKALNPSRPPSSTIAINRHAQFKPHRDNGAGNGQCQSLIVGLGDYTGGELVIEDEVVDIRYKAVEFNGWGKRHSTLPFYGERYTLVWFTPQGVNREDMFWLQDIGYDE